MRFSKNPKLKSFNALALLIVSIFSGTYIWAGEKVPLSVIDLSSSKDTKLDFESARKASDGKIQINPQSGKYYLTTSVKIITSRAFSIASEIYIGEWDLVIESPSVSLANTAKILSFENDLSNSPKSSGNLIFKNNSKNENKSEVMALEGTLYCKLRGQSSQDHAAGMGGSFQSPANAKYNLKLKFDLRGGDSELAQGGESGDLLFPLKASASDSLDTSIGSIATPQGIQIEDDSLRAQYAIK